MKSPLKISLLQTNIDINKAITYDQKNNKIFTYET